MNEVIEAEKLKQIINKIETIEQERLKSSWPISWSFGNIVDKSNNCFGFLLSTYKDFYMLTEFKSISIMLTNNLDQLKLLKLISPKKV